MNFAFQSTLKQEGDSTVIIGSDSPTLPVSFINQAFEALLDNDLILGPGDDGGYVLIGLKMSCPELFHDIKWSSNNVLEKTVEIAESLNLDISLLSPWNDIDSYDDLQAMRHYLAEENGGAANHTLKAVKDMD